ncbi:hypothetical protein GEMRC1_014176 [Eukaryota sp. GEM-RC1]
MTSSRLCVALGGNALQSHKSKGTWAETTEAAHNAMEQLSTLIESGYNLVLTHGNGPQVGSIILQNEFAKEKAPPIAGNQTMYVAGAKTQGYLGFLLQQEMYNALTSRNITPKVCSIVTQTQVSLDDPAWANPTKPVGKFYTEEEAQEMISAGTTMKHEHGKGWRVVVASPKPMKIVENAAIKTLVDNEFVVIASGGGGIPVVEDNGKLVGKPAVIDKDLSANILAQQVEADVLMILTDVEVAYRNFTSENREALRRLTVAEAEALQSEFAAGSMGPKVQACINFVKATGKRAIITSLNKAIDAVADKTGTHIVPN